MHFEDRVKRLYDCDIELLVSDIFNQPIKYKNIGHEVLKRNRVFLLDNNQIIKLFGDVQGYQRELNALKTVMCADFEVPTVIKHGIYQEVPWILMCYVAGGVISRITNPTVQSLGINLNTYHKLNIHAIDIKCYKEMLLENNNRYVDKIKKINDVKNLDLFNQAKKIFDNLYTNLNFSSSDFTLVHGDFGVRNILFNPIEHTYGLIDFEVSNIDCYMKDIVTFYMDIWQSKELVEIFFTSYFNGDMCNDLKAIFKLFLIHHCFDIFSWAKLRDPQYYQDTIEVLRYTLK